MAEVDEKDILDETALDDLYAWVDAVPLSRPKRSMARDFSDGVLVAELIHHYLPRAVEIHNYVVASSSGQKRINWNTLNRKVFAKMNIKLNEATLNQVIDAKPGAIEQILWDLRRKILEHASVAPKSGNVVVSVPSKGGLGYARLAKETVSTHLPTSRSLVATAMIPSNSKLQVPTIYQRECNSRMQLHPPAQKVTVHNYEQPTNRSQNLKVLKISETSFNTEINSRQIGVREKSFNLEDQYLGDTAASAEQTSSDVPGHIIYRGHKMVPVEHLELKEKEIKDLENAKKNLSTKIDRLEKLVEIKDTRIEDLSHQVHNIRTMYERVTQTALDEKAPIKVEGSKPNSNKA